MPQPHMRYYWQDHTFEREVNAVKWPAEDVYSLCRTQHAHCLRLALMFYIGCSPKVIAYILSEGLWILQAMFVAPSTTPTTL